MNYIVNKLCLYFSEPYYSSLDKGIRLFRNISDWQNEFERILNSEKASQGWRLSTVNIKFQLCSRLVNIN